MHHISKKFIMANHLQDERWDKRKIGRKIRKIETKIKKLWHTETNLADAQGDGAK